ncbi:phenylacetate--CoA ligase family protein [Nonomuraea aridisoli]|uniref:CoF synthetase n=1 Tax=Nonomuraea aridisoli TaxID=2070368 RepID=A0A2W2FB49_9ACTN|nr:phenylacetate--CoA ligase family protein [Nonomuraea aridisoli]PZG22078.1 CoF synthetase [Nonomuraea aridisoli]
MSTLGLIRDARKALRQGPEAIAARRRARFAELVRHARAHSPYYQQLYRHLPNHVDDPHALPVTDKEKLMERFDDWATDREITLAKADAFVNDPSLAGDRFLGKYLLTTTSGTTGRRGIYVLDADCMNIAIALTLRALSPAFTPRVLLRILATGGRTAKIVATGGHFGAYAIEMRQVKTHPRRSRTARVMSVHTPLPDLVAELNDLRPAVLESYASVAALLTREQEAGRLRIKPAIVTVGAEGLAAADYPRIAGAFGAKLVNYYGSNEAPCFAYSCAEDWLHVHSDWVVFEPVDAEHRPTPPGELSHTVLVTTLYKRVQPIIRYDLGDRVLRRPDPCPCGNPLPAIRVQGRAADVLTFPSEHGDAVRITPLALETAAERVRGVALFQIVQETPTSLRVRLRAADGMDAEHVWLDLRRRLTELLADNKLAHVTVERDAEGPRQSAGGKIRSIVPLPDQRHA